ncbi:hypothetical protein J2S74_001797 [Evansella vedderi]|uniref:Uncharacterized protein n=1 Tax=Evansella vedderi TaxID=38282 RepID=A0ABT9ZT70_9BACI|nr:hypothetical protein [Evansella vedderi]MDQ0254422.1 hypothetical protein [Evansella vedderi]
MKQNRIVILLPLSVMIGLFLFGFYIINQSSSVTNEELVNHLQMEIELIQEDENIPSLQTNWVWSDFPSDGIAGDDIIEFIFLNDSMEVIPFFHVDGLLQLEQSNEVIYEENNFYRTDEGIAFRFPNKVEDNQIYGPRGNAVLYFQEIEENVAYIEVKYYHTWEVWGMELENGKGINEILNNSGFKEYWVASRSTNFR